MDDETEYSSLRMDQTGQKTKIELISKRLKKKKRCSKKGID